MSMGEGHSKHVGGERSENNRRAFDSENSLLVDIKKNLNDNSFHEGILDKNKLGMN